MTRRLSALAALFVALLAPAVAVPDAQARRTVPHLFYGVNWDGRITEGVLATRQRTWDDMPRVGAEAVRTAFDWATAQPKRHGKFSFRATDEVMTLAAVRRIDLLPIVTLAPRWARTGDHLYAPPSHPKDYDRYLRALIGRYGPKGSFWKQHHHLPKRPIREWQIWNEPNVRVYWHPSNKKRWAEEYGKLLRSAFRTIRRYDPGASVVLAGLPNYSWNALDRLYRKAAIHGYYDVADVHPFSAQKHGVIEIVRRFKRVMARHGDGSKPLWVGELGLPASKGRAKSSSTLQTTDSGMARFLTAAYRDLIAGRSSKATRVDRAYWYTWGSMYQSNNIFEYSGLVKYSLHADREGVDAKPSFDAYQKSALKAEGRR